MVKANDRFGAINLIFQCEAKDRNRCNTAAQASSATDLNGSDRTLMASSNSPTRGHPKVPQAARLDYDGSVLIAMRAAASLSL